MKLYCNDCSNILRNLKVNQITINRKTVVLLNRSRVALSYRGDFYVKIRNSKFYDRLEELLIHIQALGETTISWINRRIAPNPGGPTRCGRPRTIVLAGPCTDQVTFKHGPVYITREDAEAYDKLKALQDLLEIVCCRIRSGLNSNNQLRCYNCCTAL